MLIAIWSVMEQALNGRSRRESKRRHFDKRTVSLCEMVTHPLSEAIDARTEFRVQGPPSLQTEETGAPGSVSRERFRAAAVECRRVDSHQEGGVDRTNGVGSSLT
jgi:hypothetical protein